MVTWVVLICSLLVSTHDEFKVTQVTGKYLVCRCPLCLSTNICKNRTYDYFYMFHHHMRPTLEQDTPVFTVKEQVCGCAMSLTDHVYFVFQSVGLAV